MNKAAKILTTYIMKKDMIKQEECELYEFGFQAALEKGLYIIISLFIAAQLHMIIEGLLFFLVFIPLRSYAGGLHLKHYYACLVLSCLTFLFVLLAGKYAANLFGLSIIPVGILANFVWLLHPIDCRNRMEDENEEKYFKKQLKKFLMIDMFITVICIVFKRNTYVSVTFYTFFITVITMVIGKYKNYLDNI